MKIIKSIIIISKPISQIKLKIITHLLTAILVIIINLLIDNLKIQIPKILTQIPKHKEPMDTTTISNNHTKSTNLTPQPQNTNPNKTINNYTIPKDKAKIPIILKATPNNPQIKTTILNQAIPITNNINKITIKKKEDNIHKQSVNIYLSSNKFSYVMQILNNIQSPKKMFLIF